MREKEKRKKRENLDSANEVPRLEPASLFSRNKAVEPIQDAESTSAPPAPSYVKQLCAPENLEGPRLPPPARVS